MLALVTWNVVSDYLTEQRISSAIVETTDNAAALQYGLFGPRRPCHPARSVRCGNPTPKPNVSVMDLLDTLPSTDSAASMLFFNDQWYSADREVRTELPPDLVDDGPRPAPRCTAGSPWPASRCWPSAYR